MSKPKDNNSQDNNKERRNTNVEKATRNAIHAIDEFISGKNITLPSGEYRQACDELLEKQKSSAKAAALFLVFYWLQCPEWDRESIPTGIRGKYGDKLLSEELSKRNITLHGETKAFGENMGWKGDVNRRKLSEDRRLGDFLTKISTATPDQREKISEYLAHRFAESKREAKPLPPVGSDVLTFARAKVLFHKLIEIKSEGHIQQFTIAALLHEFRKRHGIEIRTHHPHAADKFDATAGDIEEIHNGNVRMGYEVTVRDDWKNRMSGFQDKMDKFGLTKYVIIASDINKDKEWSIPAQMALNLEPYGRDIAIIDIKDTINFLAAELSSTELRDAINKAFEYLSDRKLSGRDEFKTEYRKTVSEWLDEATISKTSDN